MYERTHTPTKPDPLRDPPAAGFDVIDAASEAVVYRAADRQAAEEFIATRPAGSVKLVRLSEPPLSRKRRNN